jgi:hypothetical protein
MQSQLPGVMGRGLPLDQDATVNFADGQVTDVAVGRPTDPRFDLLGERLHRCTPEMGLHESSVLRPGRDGNPSKFETVIVRQAQPPCQAAPVRVFFFWRLR